MTISCSIVEEPKLEDKISSTDDKLLSNAVSNILEANSWKSSFLATKSVSQVNDNIDALSSLGLNL